MALATSELPISFGIATNQLTGQIPSLALIRRDGEVALVAVGNVSPDHIDETLESLMNQETDKVSK
jgi:hypothetical protein